MQRRDFLKAAAAVPALAFPAAYAFNPGPLQQATRHVQSWVDDGRLRAATLTVRQGGEELAEAFGEARDSDAVFLLASITKPLTATAVMILMDRGELALSDPVHRFIPEFVEGDRRTITVRHLLAHTSGLPDQLPETVELREQLAPLSEYVRGAIRTPLLFTPGERVEYQSMGILLAAEIVERITGRPLRDVLHDEVFRPLGMSRTALGLGPFTIEETARCQVEAAPGMYGGGASANTARWDWNSPYWRNLGAPWGGAHSTGPDLIRFLSYFLAPDDRVLKPETATLMVTDQNTGLNASWGLGFAVGLPRFGRACSPATFGHTGATGTLAWADPATGSMFVLLTTLPNSVSQDDLITAVSDLVSEA